MARTKQKKRSKNNATSGKVRPRPWRTAARKRKDKTNQKKKRRARPGAAALREIRKYQKSTNLLCRKLPFARVVREVMNDHKLDQRVQRVAIEALQHATEQYMIDMLEYANIIAIHAKRVTVTPSDLDLALRIRDK